MKIDLLSNLVDTLSSNLPQLVVSWLAAESKVTIVITPYTVGKIDKLAVAHLSLHNMPEP